MGNESFNIDARNINLENNGSQSNWRSRIDINENLMKNQNRNGGGDWNQMNREIDVTASHNWLRSLKEASQAEQHFGPQFFAKKMMGDSLASRDGSPLKDNVDPILHNRMY